MSAVAIGNLSELTPAQLRALKRELELKVSEIDAELSKRGGSGSSGGKTSSASIVKKPRTVIHRMTDDPAKGVTIKDIKHILDSKSITYPSSANKSTLWDIIKDQRLVRETKRYAQLRKMGAEAGRA